MFKKSLIAAATLLGLGYSGLASADPVVFDMNGGAAGGSIVFNNMTWQGGNALVVRALSTAPTLDLDGDGINETSLVRTVAQARLASFQLTSGGNASYGAGQEITYQAEFWEYATGIGGPTAAFTLAPAPAGFSNTITFYYDNSAASFGDVTTGNNYGAEGGAVKILEGTLQSLSGNFSNLTAAGASLPVNPFPLRHLDCDAYPAIGAPCVGLDGINQAPGTETVQGFGNNQVEIDVTFQNNAFFKSNVSALSLDMSQTVGVGIPFNNANPWINVVNETPYFSLVGGTRINGAACTVGGQTQGGANDATRCDQLLQTTGLSTFQTPEPTSVALVGLALTGMGLGAARRRRGAGRA